MTPTILQGQFKRPVAFADMVMGCQFSRRLNVPFNLPFLSTAISWLLDRVGGGQIDALSDSPHLLTPLMAAAQVRTCARQDEQNDCLHCWAQQSNHKPAHTVLMCQPQPTVSQRCNYMLAGPAARTSKPNGYCAVIIKTLLMYTQPHSVLMLHPLLLSNATSGRQRVATG